MKTEKKLVLLMSLIDENLARIFLLDTPLKDAVAKTVDLADLESKIQKFEVIFDRSVTFNFAKTMKDSFSLLAKDAGFSKIMCDYYLEWLSPKSSAFRLKEIDSKAVTALAKNYRRVLNKIITIGGKDEPNAK